MDATAARLKKMEKKLGAIVEKDFARKNDGHEPGHPARVCKMAMHLQAKEGGDIVVLIIATWLHDYHRLSRGKNGHGCHPKNSLKRVRKIISELGIKLSSTRMKKILNCVKYHEEGTDSTPKNARCIETAIIQDADAINELGATGLIRDFRFSGAHNIPVNDAIAHMCKGGAATFGRRKINTASAIPIAEARFALMVDFFRKFHDEEHGEA